MRTCGFVLAAVALVAGGAGCSRPAIVSNGPTPLLEEARQAADLEAARRGADWLLARLPDERQAGLYTGLAGLGFALTETGWMQGAAGIGAWLLRLDGFDRGRPVAIVLPDSPFGR
jgi:hypothetical protein